MGQTVCRYVSDGGGGKTTPKPYKSCTYEEWAPLANMFVGEPTALYAIHAVGILLLALLWLFSFTMKFKDYTRSFVMANLAPLSVSILFSLISVINGTYDTYSQPSIYSLRGVITLILFSAQETYYISLPVTLVIFQILNLRTARKRVEVIKHWHFFIVPVIFAIVNVATFIIRYEYIIFRIIDLGLQGTLFVLGIVNFVNLCALCCCSSPRHGQSSIPSVSNARSRMGWSILFAGFSLIPIHFLESYNFIMNLNGYNFISEHVDQLVWFCSPIIFSVCVLLFLPAYRSILCCSQAYENNKVGEMQIVVQIKAEDLAKNFPGIQAQNLAIPTANQSSSPYLNQKQPILDFGAVLTNPPNATPYPIAQQAPAVYQPPPQPCTCAHGMPTPAHPIYVAPPNMYPLDQLHLLQHQQALMPQQIVSTPMAQPPMQTNLVRFASQPNLAAVQTLQPAMSVPQLNNLPQSPFYIQN